MRTTQSCWMTSGNAGTLDHQPRLQVNLMHVSSSRDALEESSAGQCHPNAADKPADMIPTRTPPCALMPHTGATL